MAADFYQGFVIDGRYELEKPLGVGGMGEVWLARHLSLKSWVALKLIRPKWFDDEQTIKRFMREARSTAQLTCPHIVRVTDHGRNERLVYIVMEFLQGMTLREVMKQCRDPIHLKDVTRIMSELGVGVESAHRQGILHRDLKPGNIFIVQEKDGWHVKVMDFGLAKLMDSAEDDSIQLETRQDSLIGTPAYMSPERLRLDRSDTHADLWSLAVIAYELVVGERPYSGKTRLNIMVRIATQSPPRPSDFGDVPNGFDAWFERATAQDPDQRFQTVTEFTSALKTVLNPASRAHSSPRIDQFLITPEMDYDQSLDKTAAFGTKELNSMGLSGEPRTGTNTRSSDLGRTRFTPMQVAELQTQIQYGMMERLRTEHLKNLNLSQQLSTSGDSDADSSGEE